MADTFFRRITWVASCGLFVFSLTQPGHCTGDCHGSLFLLLAGWMGIMVEAGTLLSGIAEVFQNGEFSVKQPLGATFTWLANPLLFASWMFLRKKSGMAVRLSLLATLLTLSFLLFGQVIHDEAGHYSRITGYGPGYWLWVASAATAFLGGLCLTYAKRKEKLSALADTSGWWKR